MENDDKEPPSSSSSFDSKISDTGSSISDERISQIEAMGGDPFFLSDDDDDENNVNDDYKDTLNFEEEEDQIDQEVFSAEAAMNMMAMSSA